MKPARAWLRAVALLLAGLSTSWLMTRLWLGLSVYRLTIKWDIRGYEPVFVLALAFLGTVYFLTVGSRSSWIRDAFVGILAGILAGVIAMVSSAWLGFGSQGLSRGFKVTGPVYLLVLSGAIVFPLCGWLIGGLTLTLMGQINRHLIVRP